MTRPPALVTALVAALVAALALTLPAASQTASAVAWDADSNPPQTARIQAWRGDTVPLAPRWGSSQTNGWAFVAYWSTNGAAWWSKSLAPGAYDLAGDPFLWTPDMDTGAAKYRLFIRASNAGGASYRANAEIFMLDSPGQDPATLQLPVQTIDFAAVTPINAPWVDNGDDRLSGWDAAHSWGDHAAAGYLAAQSWFSWISTNGLASTQAVAEAVAAIPAPDLSAHIRRDQSPQQTADWWVLHMGTPDSFQEAELSQNGLMWTASNSGLSANGLVFGGTPYGYPSGPAARIATQADLAAAPDWIVYTNAGASVTVTNDLERPVRLYGAGAATGTVSFAGLREPLPVYVEASGFPGIVWANAHTVGGGLWQTNMVNIFLVWRSGPDTFVNPVTARPR